MITFSPAHKHSHQPAHYPNTDRQAHHQPQPSKPVDKKVESFFGKSAAASKV
jgi:hypothetical protein